jgi:hypothetical protein
MSTNKIYKSQPALIPNLFEGTVYKCKRFLSFSPLRRFVPSLQLSLFDENLKMLQPSEY